MQDVMPIGSKFPSVSKKVGLCLLYSNLNGSLTIVLLSPYCIGLGCKVAGHNLWLVHAYWMWCKCVIACIWVHLQYHFDQQPGSGSAVNDCRLIDSWFGLEKLVNDLLHPCVSSCLSFYTPYDSSDTRFGIILMSMILFNVMKLLLLVYFAWSYKAFTV